ncbi:hypothetical protein KEM52_000132 [Ascosphaera acerosa]|nr:hypothetical protein KEM52_000132 [Ascosphaera acerosa]
MLPRATRVGEAYKSPKSGADLPKVGERQPAASASATSRASTSETHEPSLEERVRALEEAKKLGQIDEETFRSVVSKLGVGGDTSSTHLVKGLDWELLRRVKAGEDVSKKATLQVPPTTQAVGAREDGQADEPDDFDQVMAEKEKQQVVPVARQQRTKQGALAPEAAAAAAASAQSATRVSRDEILRQLRASRAAAAAGAALASSTPSAGGGELSSKFKKIGSRDDKQRWIEQDSSGRRREVLLTKGPDGKTKRKVRYIDPPATSRQAASGRNGLLEVDRTAQPLGMEVPEESRKRAAAAAQHAEDDDDEDIFADAGRDYDPLADVEQGSSSDDEGSGNERAMGAPSAPQAGKDREQPSQPRDYFGAKPTDSQAGKDEPSNPLLKDPTFLAAVKKAAALRQADDAVAARDHEASDEETANRRKRFLEEARKRDELDTIDIDMSFGGGGYGEDDDDDLPVQSARAGSKRKRGPKKKKQDKNSAADVLQVLEGRGAAGDAKR